MPQINLGTVANDGTGSPLRTGGQYINQYGQLGDKIVNAAFYKTASNTIEAAISLAIVAAAALGAGAAVWVPASMLPYTASLVTFNSAVRMTREGGRPDTYDVRAYGAAGNLIADDRLSIVAAQAAAQAVNGASVYFPVGNYTTSDYIDVGQGTIWVGDGLGDIAALGNTTITATGTNKGVLRFRPGTIGSIGPIQRELFVAGIGFTGSGVGTNQGHLVTIARIIHARFLNCFFNNTRGQGLKDDQVTLTGAAGVHLFGCEIVSFIDCNFENNNNATNGAGVLCEDAIHGLSFGGECHFGGNTYAVRASNFTVGQQNAEWFFNACFFFGNKTIMFCDIGGVIDVSFASCHVEGCTALNPAACLIDGGTTNPLQNWTFLNCSLQLPNATSLFTANVNIDYSSWINCRLVGVATTNGFVHSTTVRANSLINNYWTGITNAFVSVSQQGFDTIEGPVLTFTATPASAKSVAMHDNSVTLTDGANVATNLLLGNRFFLNAAGPGVRTMTNPTGLPPTYGGNSLFGQLIRITIKNSSGGALTVNWGTSWHLAGAWVSPANTFQRSIMFEWDPVTQVAYELSRSAADVTP